MCEEPINVDSLIVVQNFGAERCHPHCVKHAEQCAVIHLGRIEPGHMPVVKKTFNIIRFVSNATSCDAETKDGHFIRINYIQ